MLMLNSIKKKLFLASVALVVIPTVCIILIVNQSVGSRAQQDFTARMAGEMSQVSNVIDILLENALLNLDMICTHPAIKKLDGAINSFMETKQPTDMSVIKRNPVEQELFNHLALIQATHPDYIETYIGTRHGGMITSSTSPMNAGYDPRKRPWYQDALKNPGKATVANAFLSTTGDYAIAIVKAVKGPNGEVEFVGAVEITLKKLTEIINSTKIGSSGYLMLAEPDGAILAHRNKELLSKKVADLKIPQLAEAMTSTTATIFYEEGGVKQMAHIVTAPLAGWKIIGSIEHNEIMSGARLLMMIILVSGIVFTLIAIAMGYLIAKRVADPISSVVKVVNQIAGGDLSADIPVTSNDEMGQLQSAMQTMTTELRRITQTVQESTETVNTAAREIAQGSADLSQRTQAQASALEETASSMEELASTVKQSADNAGQANQMARAAHGQAEQGGQVVEQAMTAISAINQSSQKIADIIGVIDEIAFQTNLLALNAAVEAARAGEQGRGFAVVAGEVRKLAQRSAEAAKEIKGLITDSVNKVKDGSHLVERSGHTLKEMVTSIKKVSDIVAEIAAATREQASGIDQVNKAILQIDEATQQNATLVEETAAASNAMGDQAKELQNLMSFFKLDERATPTRASVTAAPSRSAADQHSRPATPIKSVATKPRPVAKPAPVRPQPTARPAPVERKPTTTAISSSSEEWEEF